VEIIYRAPIGLFFYNVPRETSSAEVSKKVEKAIKIQLKRFGKAKMNSEMNIKDIEKYCSLAHRTLSFLEMTYEKEKYLCKGIPKILKVSRTITDLEGENEISENHIAMALNFRFFGGISGF